MTQPEVITAKAALVRRRLERVRQAAAAERGTRLRNPIAHGYGQVDGAKLHAAASSGCDEIEGFLGEIGSWLARRGASG